MPKTGTIAHTSSTSVEFDFEPENYSSPKDPEGISVSASSFHVERLPETKALRISEKRPIEQVNLTIDAEQMLERERIRAINKSIARKLRAT
jgi:hypothetical protein